MRNKFEADPQYLALAEQARIAQAKLEADYPGLFVTDEELRARRQKAMQAVKDDPGFKKAVNDRGQAYREQQEYLLMNDERLAELVERIDRTNQ
ncbi:MAG: hypothetical protein P1U89_14695 [Verrucomicrobiales bacterium]|nr:hypothetical protein [Verrucomicrobiales bacterium]